MLERMRGAVALVVTMLLAGAVASVPACRNGRSGGDSSPPSAVAASPSVILHGRDARSIVVHVELASTEPDRARGLMYRNHLEPDAGMLFLFPEPSPLAFWMKNTLIPLDIIFIRPNGTIGRITHAQVLDPTPLPSGGPVIGVLEIRAGRSAELGITVGDKVSWKS